VEGRLGFVEIAERLDVRRRGGDRKERIVIVLNVCAGFWSRWRGAIEGRKGREGREGGVCLWLGAEVDGTFGRSWSRRSWVGWLWSRVRIGAWSRV
jgi:hypothetical protein